MSLLRAQEVNNNLDILPKHVGRPKFFFYIFSLCKGGGISIYMS